MTILRLLADDLTGALDAAAELVAVAGPVHAFSYGAIPPALPRNAALDSGTRELRPGPAVARVIELTSLLAEGSIAFKKIDSLMRGATLAEAAACFQAGAWAHAILAPAFPYQGRVTRNGVQYARDASGGWAPMGGDIVQRLRSDGAPAQPGRVGARLLPGITVFDVETDEDLLRIAAQGKAAPSPVLWIGAGGLAQALAGKAKPSPFSLDPPLLGLFGSDQPVTAGQLAACGADWMRFRHGGPAASRSVAARLQTSGKALVSLDLPSGLDREEAAARIGAELHRLVKDLPPPGTLLVAGGETLRGLCRSLGASCLEVQGRIVPGLPCSVMRGGRWDGVTVVSKSGAFGPPNLLRDLLSSTCSATERKA